MLKVFISFQNVNPKISSLRKLAIYLCKWTIQICDGPRPRKFAHKVALQFFINQTHGLLFAYEHYEMLYCFRSEENYRLEINEPLKQMWH